MRDPIDETGRLLDIQEAFEWRGSGATSGELKRNLSQLEQIKGALGEPEPVDPALLKRLHKAADEVLAREQAGERPWGVALAALVSVVFWAGIKLHPFPTKWIHPLTPIACALVVGAFSAWRARRRGQLV